MATEKDDKEKPEPEEKEEAAEEKPAPKPEPKVTEDEEGNVTVDVAPRRPRRERRQERFDELRRAQDENEGLRARMAQMEAQLYGRLQQVEQRIPQGEDPYHKQLTAIRQQQELIQSALRTGAVTSQDEVERLRGQFYQLDNQARQLDRDLLKSEVMEQVKQQTQRREGEYEEQVLRAEYPDVIAHPSAMRYANGLYHTMVAEGKPPNLKTSREALDKAAERFGLRQQPLPVASAAQQARYGAVPAQAGAKGGEIRLDASDKKMALARWPQLDEHQAYAKMASLLAKTREREAQE